MAGASANAQAVFDQWAKKYGEDQARYVVTARDADSVLRRAGAAGVPVLRLGATGGTVLALADARPLPVEELKRRFEAWLPQYMASPL